MEMEGSKEERTVDEPRDVALHPGVQVLSLSVLEGVVVMSTLVNRRKSRVELGQGNDLQNDAQDGGQTSEPMRPDRRRGRRTSPR